MDQTTYIFDNVSDTIIEESNSDIKETTSMELIKTQEYIDINDSIISDLETTKNQNIYETDNSETSYLNSFGSEEAQRLTDITKNSHELSLEDLFGDKYNEINLSNEQIKELYEDIKEYIYNNYNGEDIIIHTGNLNVQISTLDSQLDSELSNVDLGKCSEIIKEKYCKSDNDTLIMLKFDITPENEKSTYVQYEVYEQTSKLFLELKECTGTNVIINTPVELESYIESLYNMLNKSGYNLFDANDSFYHDICTAYTTENGTDILLYDRRMDIYQLTVNKSLCQEGCTFLSYNSETKKAECNCPIQTKEMNLDLNDLKFDKNKMLDEFFETLKNSNFKVLKCYELIYNLQVFIHNIGCIIMSILLFLFNILAIIYLVKNSKKINFFIQSILRKKFSDENSFIFSKGGLCLSNNNNLNNNEFKKAKLNNSKSKLNNAKENKELKKEKNKDNKKGKKKKKKGDESKKKNKKNKLFRNSAHFIKKYSLNLDENKNINSKEKNINKNCLLVPPKRSKINENKCKNKKNIEIINPINIFSINKLISSKSSFNVIENNYNNYNTNINVKNVRKNNEIFYKRKSIKKSIKSTFKNKENKLESSTDSKSQKAHNSKNNLDLSDKSNEQEIDLNDQQMNSLEYEKALKLDKRTYFQYYLSLIKKKHLILFTFMPTNDYNVMSLKISLFLVSFSLYLSVNAFFFNDDTMHKIYNDNGVYHILYQIPQILYSSVISSIINILLKFLSLSEKDILKIKEEKSAESTVQKSKETERCIKIKFSLFFIISLLLMSFFWYFISCFCAVYSNTQTILFKDTLISFSISMVYPFGINLLPGIFRIPALRAEKKDKKCLYSFSQYVALI